MILRKSARACLPCLLLTVYLLTACGKPAPGANFTDSYDTDAPTVMVPAGRLAENDAYTLEWDPERVCVRLHSKTSGGVWSTIPYSYYQSGESRGRARVMMESPVILEYFTPSTQTTNVLYAYTEVIQNGRVSSTTIEDGIEVMYWFDTVKIGVPVTYTLTDQGLLVSLEPSDIVEGDSDSLAYRISLSPYLAAAENSESGNYLIIPSGSGALMYTDERGDGGRTFSGEVYGSDPAVEKPQKLHNDTPIRLPVFGAVDGSQAICGIIESGEGQADIQANAGDDRVGYSSVYATFRVRGYNRMYIEYSGRGTMEMLKLTDNIIHNGPLSVGYYPLPTEVANYTGLAQLYTDYLRARYGMSSKEPEALLNLTMLGGYQEKDFFLGIPYDRTVPLTTYQSAETMLRELSSLTNGRIAVNLSGFGSTGMDVGKIGGGFLNSSPAGTDKQRQKLMDYCQEKGIDAFVDYDLVRFRNSGNGFSPLGDSAKNVNQATAYQYTYSLSLRNINEQVPRYGLLSRLKLTTAGQTLLKKTDRLDIDRLSLSTLGSLAYSDYQENGFALKNRMAADVAAILRTFKDNGRIVSVSEANAYAAASADRIADAPTLSNMESALDATIPLYQMIFKGYLPVSNTAINLAAQPRQQFLKAMESGTGLSFSLYSENTADLPFSHHTALYASWYPDVVDMIRSMLEESEDYLAVVSGDTITNHRLLAPGLTSTTFSGGITVYVNFSKSAQETPAGVVPAQDFKYTTGG